MARQILVTVLDGKSRHTVQLDANASKNVALFARQMGITVPEYLSKVIEAGWHLPVEEAK